MKRQRENSRRSTEWAGNGMRDKAKEQNKDQAADFTEPLRLGAADVWVTTLLMAQHGRRTKSAEAHGGIEAHKPWTAAWPSPGARSPRPWLLSARERGRLEWEKKLRQPFHERGGCKPRLAQAATAFERTGGPPPPGAGLLDSRRLRDATDVRNKAKEPLRHPVTGVWSRLARDQETKKLMVAGGQPSR